VSRCYSVGYLTKVMIMYIYDLKPSGPRSRFTDQRITSRLVQRHSYDFDRIVSTLLGHGENTRTYGWAAEGLGRFVVFNLPKAGVKVPDDQALRVELGKIKTNEARALGRVFLAFGKPKQFEETLLTALRALPLPGEGLKRYEVYLARLGAEAFILGLSVTGDKRFHVGFVDHPNRLRDSLSLSHQEYFLHFAIRRLLAASSPALAPDAQRNMLARGAALFSALQSELAREYRLIGIPKTLLVDYRRLLVAIIWKHYQMQMDHLLEKTRSSQLRFADLLKQLDVLLKKASITRVHDEHATVPTFHTGSREYRDYFTPSDRTDIGFIHFSRTAHPGADGEPNISFRTVVRRRAQQMSFLEDLQKRSHPRLPPRLHDSTSWQVWLRDMWDGDLRSLPTDKRMAAILKVVEQYFEAFTAHVPYDLREGCKERNYLTRSFPRAVTGGLVHDCAVYAVRWIHMLGRLIAAKSPPTGLKDPRIFLIEMPGHEGVMIRASKRLGDDILVSINNKYAKMHDLDRAERDDVAAKVVVQDHHQGPRTPFIVRRITASPADATSLWKEVCRIHDIKLRLPYAATSEPHLRYLAYNAGIAHVARQLADTVGGLWLDFLQGLAAARTQNRIVPRERVQAELNQYYRSVEKAVRAASDQYQRDVNPLIDEINNDLRVNQHRLPKGAVVAETTPQLKPWESSWLGYRPELEKAVKSGDISQIDPERFFPDDDFVAAVE
jgi:hypothetical protein